MKFYYNRTKIVATMGPASAKKDVLLSMIRAGLNVCRLNFSHGKPEDHKKFVDLIREINAEYKTNVGILADLQGPKIRIGLVKDGGIHLLMVPASTSPPMSALVMTARSTSLTKPSRRMYRLTRSFY
jgi:pyruvate kinase